MKQSAKLSAVRTREDDLAYRVAALEAVLRDRERELLEVKGPCSSARCRLHYAHSGPCDIRAEGAPA